MEERERKAMREATTALRIDMRQQVIAQAPEGATGYRLVLPAERPGELPRFVPRRKLAHGAAAYRLSPFDYPKDLRLRDGCWYRILWVDKAGRRVRSQRRAPVPGLYYFVGPAAAQDAATAAYNEALRMAKGTKHEAGVTAEAVQYQMSLARTRDMEAQLRRTAAESEMAIRQMAEAAKVKPPAGPAQAPTDAFPWKSVGLAALVGVPSLLSMWLGWREWKRWVEKSAAPGLPAAAADSTVQAIGPWDAAIQALAEKWPEITAPLRPLIEESSVDAPASTTALSAGAATNGSTQDNPSMQTAQPATQAISPPVSAGHPLVERPSQPAGAAASVPALTTAEPVKLAEEPESAPPAVEPALHKSALGEGADVTPQSLPSINSPTAESSQAASTTESQDVAPEITQTARATAIEGPASVDRPDPSLMLNPKEINRLCELICDTDQCSYMLYKQRRRSAIDSAQPVPQEPLLSELSGESRKEIRRLASDGRLVAWFVELHERFLLATQPGSDAPLPPPFRELSTKERERAKTLLSTKEHMQYALDQILRASALLAGATAAPERAIELPEHDRKSLNKLLRDRRMVAFVSKLLLQAAAAEE